VPAGASILGPNNGASILVQWVSTGGTITVKGSNTCGISGARSLACVISCRMSQVNNSVPSLNTQVYPNPASEKATVKFTAGTSDYSLSITDVLGQTAMTTYGKSVEGTNMIELDLGAFAKGVYTLNLICDENSEQVRLVIQ
jgi:hypothetical protein